MLLLLSLLLSLFLLCLLAKRRFEQVIAPFFCGLMVACYPLALIGRLNVFPWLSCGAALVLAVVAAVCAARGRISLASWPRLLFTPGFACFALLAAFLYAGALPRVVWWGDEIRYWAMAPKSLYLSGGVLDGAHTLTPDFSSYTPGIPLLQWVGLTAYGEWSEGVLYFVLFLFEAAFLMPFAEKISWKKAYWAPLFLLFLVGMPTLFNAFTYYSLSVDTALGLCFGYVLATLWRFRQAGGSSPQRLAGLCLSLCALVLIKQVGVAFLLLTASFLLVCPRGKAGVGESVGIVKIGASGKVGLAVAFGVPLLLLASWYGYCLASGLAGAHAGATGKHVGELLSGAWQPPEGWASLLPALWKALVSDLRGCAVLTDHALLEIPCLYRMLLFCAAPPLLCLVLPARKRELTRLLPWTIIAFALELLGLVFCFMTAFYTEVGEYVGQGSALFPLLIERYFCPLFFGLGLVLLSMATGAREPRFPLITRPGAASRPSAASDDKEPGSKAVGESTIGEAARKKAACRNAALALLALAVLAVLCNWQSVRAYLLPAYYEAREQDYFAESLAEQNFWTDELEEPQNAVVLLGIGEDQTEPEKWQYALAPVKLVYETNERVASADFAQLLEARGITHVVTLDFENAVYEVSAEYLPDAEMDTYVPYAVRWEDGAPLLEE